MEIEEIISRAKQVVRHYIDDPQDQVVLYGSWTTGRAINTSDVDIGIYAKRPVDPLIMVKIREDLTKLPTLRKVDVVDFSTASERFRRLAMERARNL